MTSSHTTKRNVILTLKVIMLSLGMAFLTSCQKDEIPETYEKNHDKPCFSITSENLGRTVLLIESEIGGTIMSCEQSNFGSCLGNNTTSATSAIYQLFDQAVANGTTANFFKKERYQDLFTTLNNYPQTLAALKNDKVQFDVEWNPGKTNHLFYHAYDINIDMSQADEEDIEFTFEIILQ
jgi:hypothetical protein